MTQPLALVLYEKLLPGSQLVNRLQDMKYRVQVITDPALLAQTAAESGPMLVLADLGPNSEQVCAAIASLKQSPATKHVPVVVITPETAPALGASAQAAGATLVVHDAAVLTHLPQILEQAIRVD
jgi:CheY-like chemotaxis protein